MRKWYALCALTACILTTLTGSVIAGRKYNSFFGGKDWCVTLRDQSGDVNNDQCDEVRVTSGLSDDGDYFTLVTGAPVGGYVTMASNETTISTSYSYIGKYIADDIAFTQSPLPDGVSGQTLVIEVLGNYGTLTWTVTPSRSTNWSELIFEGPRDRAVLLYLDDTYGWIILNNDTVQFNL